MVRIDIVDFFSDLRDKAHSTIKHFVEQKDPITKPKWVFQPDGGHQRI